MKFSKKSMPAIILALLLIGSADPASAQPDANCVDTESNLAWWQEIIRNRDEARIQADALAYDLLPCLGSPNSELRDTIGYGLYTYWLRNELLAVQTKQFLYEQLSGNLDSEDSLLRSFSALVLSEILRADTVTQFLSDSQRSSLLQLSIQALTAENDYRGLDAQLGWIHPIAHLSDVLWRFALHPSLEEDQARQIISAVRARATPVDVSYIFNEGDRLARVIATLMQRDLIAQEQWLEWMSGFERRMDTAEWGTAFGSIEGMAELHNGKLFVRALASQLEGVELSENLESKLDEILAILSAMV